MRHLQIEQVEAQRVSRARHAAAAERFREADARCAAMLRTLSVDGIADSLPYRVLSGASGVGHDVASLAPVATVVPELKPVVAVADGVAVTADAALLAAYGEGDAGQLAVATGLSVAGAFGGALRLGATAGAERTASGRRVHGPADGPAAGGPGGREAGPRPAATPRARRSGCLRRGARRVPCSVARRRGRWRTPAPASAG